MEFPRPALVRLSGRATGQEVPLEGERVRVGSGSGADVHVPASELPSALVRSLPDDNVLTLKRRGDTYELEAPADSGVSVNGEQVRDVVLGSGDVVVLGQGGPALRFRLYPAGSRGAKSVREALSDSIDYARYSTKNPLRRAGIVMLRAPRELTTRTTRIFRAGVLVVLAVLLVVVGVLGYQNWRLQQRLSAGTARIEGLNELLERAEKNSFSPEDFEAARSEFVGQISAALARVKALESRFGARERVIVAASPAVVFLQGSYGFREPGSGRQLRFVGIGPNGIPLPGPDGEAAVTLEGNGPPVEILYTGSAFVVTPDGHLVTNRHVVAPWLFDPQALIIAAQGLTPVLQRFIGYFPGVPEPVEIEIVSESDTADVALMRCDALPDGLRHLDLTTAPPRVGDEVIVLGYPTGMHALVARADADQLEEFAQGQPVDFWSLARILAETGHIAPLATVGIVGQATAASVVYDAETTHGGSGGPVLGLDGSVVAVNSAILPDFDGSNMGVPIEEVSRMLLESAPAAEKPVAQGTPPASE